MVSIFLGSYMGGRITEMPKEQTHVLWLGFCSQAGMSLGLAAEAGAYFFDSFGSSFQSTLTSIILMNLVIGPLLGKVPQ